MICLTDRAKEIRKANDLLEKDMDFLGVTGVEDKFILINRLQDDV
jgi:magnesium-transporting ATPase (P-type)